MVWRRSLLAIASRRAVNLRMSESGGYPVATAKSQMPVLFRMAQGVASSTASPTALCRTSVSFRPWREQVKMAWSGNHETSVSTRAGRQHTKAHPQTSTIMNPRSTRAGRQHLTHRRSTRRAEKTQFTTLVRQKKGPNGVRVAGVEKAIPDARRCFSGDVGKQCRGFDSRGATTSEKHI